MDTEFKNTLVNAYLTAEQLAEAATRYEEEVPTSDMLRAFGRHLGPPPYVSAYTESMPEGFTKTGEEIYADDQNGGYWIGYPGHLADGTPAVAGGEGCPVQSAPITVFVHYLNWIKLPPAAE